MKLKKIIKQIIKESFANNILNTVKDNTYQYDILYYYLIKADF